MKNQFRTYLDSVAAGLLHLIAALNGELGDRIGQGEMPTYSLPNGDAATPQKWTEALHKQIFVSMGLSTGILKEIVDAEDGSGFSLSVKDEYLDQIEMLNDTWEKLSTTVRDHLVALDYARAPASLFVSSLVTRLSVLQTQVAAEAALQDPNKEYKRKDEGGGLGDILDKLKVLTTLAGVGGTPQ